MIRSSLALGLLALLVPTLARAQSPVFGQITQGTPEIKSIEALACAPGALLIGDGRGAQAFAIKLEPQPAQKWAANAEIPGFADKLAERLGTTAKGIEIIKMVVDPQTNLAYVAVRKLDGKKDLIMVVDAGLKITELPLENVGYARIGVADKSVGITKITDIAWSGKSVLVATQASKEFGSQVLVAPAPLSGSVTGTVFGTKTYHVAHGKWETNAPIRTLMPYQENGKNYVVGAFTCTPIVKYAVDDLKPGARVEGVSVIELGMGNTPQDMFSYEKNGKSYILMTSVRNNKQPNKEYGPSAYWTVKVDQNILTEATKINTTAQWRQKGAGERAQIVADLTCVMMMDRLGTDQALVIREGKGGVKLAAVALP